MTESILSTRPIKEPLYLKGVSAIKNRHLKPLLEVLNHYHFNRELEESRTLLFFAAEVAYLEAFQAIGDAGVPLSAPKKIFKKSPQPNEPKNSILLIKESTPLHTLFRNLNIRMYDQIHLEKHFNKRDIINTLNTYSLDEEGTPLDIAWSQNYEAFNFLFRKAITTKQECFSFPNNFYVLFQDSLKFNPDLTASRIVSKPLFFQKAIIHKDIPTLRIIAEPTVKILNLLKYKYSQIEYNALSPYLSDELKQKMNLSSVPVLEEKKPIKIVSRKISLKQKIIDGLKSLVNE